MAEFSQPAAPVSSRHLLGQEPHRYHRRACAAEIGRPARQPEPLRLRRTRALVMKNDGYESFDHLNEDHGDWGRQASLPDTSPVIIDGESAAQYLVDDCTGKLIASPLEQVSSSFS